jgi:tRNA threonylcarbamoyladenosine biosynthesis protein TsaE
MKQQRYISHSPEETWEIAERIVVNTPGRLVLALHGELGSGKTCFVKGVALALGIDQPIMSPTFTIIREYRGTRPLYHVDLYRLNNPNEVLAIGFEEYLQADGITAVEWAERAGDLIPQDATRIKFEALAEPDERAITVSLPDDRDSGGR